MLSIFYLKNQKGFSLIEMMVVVVILGLIVLGLVTFFTGGTKSWVVGQYQLAAQRNARQSMDRMVREIREGNNFTIGPNNNSVTISYLDSFEKSSVTYSWSSNKGDPVLRGTVQLINNVKKLEFTSTDASKVHIILEVDVDDDGNPDITLNTDVSLRNFGL